MKPTDQQIRRLGEWFDAALLLDGADRDSFLARCDADDAELGRRLRALLRRDARLSDATGDTTVPDAMRRLRGLRDGQDRAVVHAGEYRLIEEIGHGGMGRVWRASREREGFTQEVAIKFVRRELLHPALLKRFSTERRILASLDHPGIARLIDADTSEDGTPYVVMDYVRGIAVDRWCDRERLDIAARLRLFRQILAAVSHAHACLIVHRDIKAANVLVSDTGQAHLLDFGIAKQLHGEDAATATAERFFTAHSAAPEQLSGAPVGVACDIYALGMLLYELLAGRAPFDFMGLSPGEVERSIRGVPPPSLSNRAALGDPDVLRHRGCRHSVDLQHALQGDVEHIVQRCLRKLPSERYPSVAALDADIDNLLHRRPISARMNDRWYRFGKFVARNRLAFGSAIALTATVTIAVLMLARQSLILAAERDRAQDAIALLKNAFAAANPTQVAGSAVSARQVLDAARPALEERFASQPALYAELAATLVDVELSLGRGREAAALAARAAQAAERAQLAPAQRRDLLILQARAATSIDDAAAAARYLESARALGGAQDVAWQLARGRLLYLDDDTAAAVLALRQAVAATAGRDARDQLATTARLQLAQALRLDGDNAAALDVLDETLAWQRRSLDPRHPRITLTRLQRLVPLRRERGAPAALDEARDVLSDVVAVFGAHSSVAASAHAELGGVLNELGDGRGAADAFRAALAAWRSAVGPDHQNTLRTAFNLAQMLAELPERHAEAEALYRDVIRRGSASIGADLGPVPMWRMSLAEFLLDNGRRGEAADLLATLDQASARRDLNAATGAYLDALLARARAIE